MYSCIEHFLLYYNLLTSFATLLLISFSTRPADSCNFGAIEKLTHACYFKIALKTMHFGMSTQAGFNNENLVNRLNECVFIHLRSIKINKL